MSKVFLVCALGLLGVLSLGSGFGAEVTRNKASNIKPDTVNVKCEYPNSPATALGVTAAVSLMMAQGILIAATRCVCCSKSATSCNRLLLFVFSGVTFFIALGLLIGGAALNNGSGSGTRQSGGYIYLQCYYAKPGIFAAGGLLSAVSVLCGTFYFLSIVDPKKRPAITQEGFPVGQPQFPPNDSTKDFDVVNV